MGELQRKGGRPGRNRCHLRGDLRGAQQQQPRRLRGPWEGAMTNTQDDTPPGDHPTKNRPKADYDVGYCRPPAAHRFKHGNKANPKGRKKGSRDRKIVKHEVLFEDVTVREGGEIRQMPALEAVLKKLLSKALAGDNKAALTIIGIAQKEGILTTEQEQVVESLSESDLAIMGDGEGRLEAAALELPLPSSKTAPDPLGRAEPPTP